MTFRVFDDAVGWVQTHSDRFFRAGTPNDLELARWVWMDATLSGCRDVIVHHDGNVWAIAASANWLTDKVVSASELFVRMVTHPEGGPNSLRSEVVLNAFCAEVVAITGGDVVFNKGDGAARSTLEAVLGRWAGLEAGVAFRL